MHSSCGIDEIDGGWVVAALSEQQGEEVLVQAHPRACRAEGPGMVVVVKTDEGKSGLDRQTL